MKNSITTGIALTLCMFLSMPLMANEERDKRGFQQSADETRGFQEGRLEGQVWASFALNEHLNAFDLSVNIEDDTATLEGVVNQDVSKELAEQIALSVDGIDNVRNRIEVDESATAGSRQADAANERHPGAERQARSGDHHTGADRQSESRTFGDRVGDATTTATVKSKLLWNSETSGLDIEVETENGVVTLAGEAEGEANKELAERLASNTRGVERVINNIEIERDRR